MKIILILILIILLISVVPFIVGLIAGAINSKKKFKANSLDLFRKLSDAEQKTVSNIWHSFKLKDAGAANNTLFDLDADSIEHIKHILALKNRPLHLSGGLPMDNVTWDVWKGQAQKIGFEDDVADILAGIGIHGINDIIEGNR